METLREKANKYAMNNNSGYSDSQSSGLRDGYIAGYTEANKWIGTEEELPPLERGKHYLCKVEYSFPKNCKVIICEFYEDTKTFRCESSDEFVNDVTHWRPID